MSAANAFGPDQTPPRVRPVLRRSGGRTGPAPHIPTSASPSLDALDLQLASTAEASFTPASVASPPASASFPALPDDGTQFNPDTQGAVGPNHLMVMLASQVRVQDHTGNTLTTISLSTF
ncbi:MAG TPA: hypothetical protein VNH84_04740 [Candidatus Saccharimonadales bacterium]|nr:hypothetical protein [Candidatus Saccharimonadales bacterium]